ncbi:type II toxin-antitoxin system VapC family toxin [Anaerolineales bacterium HSG25]|nr:type II toxin-antitoxin system VapC family toxin [Anaerolineales bacterium HSG25]
MSSAYFFDANAIYKYYQDEAGSETVRQLVQDNPYRCFISEWSVVEFISIFRKYIQADGVKKAEQETRKNQFYGLYQRFQNDLQSRLFIIMPIPVQWRADMSGLIIRLAIDPLDVTARPSLKPPDALQFITFQQLCQTFPQTCMVTNDKPLTKVCKLEQLAALDPCNT